MLGLVGQNQLSAAGWISRRPSRTIYSFIQNQWFCRHFPCLRPRSVRHLEDIPSYDTLVGGRSFWRRDFLFWFSDLQLSASLMFWSENYILWSQDKLAWFAEPNDKAECSPFLVELLPLFSQIVFGWKENNRNQTNSQASITLPTWMLNFYCPNHRKRWLWTLSLIIFNEKINILYSPGLDENLLMALSLILDGK